MTDEPVKAEMLKSYQFFKLPDMPTVGILRLETENENHFVMVTKGGLRKLAEACSKHADELAEIQ